MNAIPYQAPEEEFEHEPFVMPARRRRRLWGPLTGLFVAAVVGAGCFYAGVRVEKGQLSSSTSGARRASGLSSFAGGGFARALGGGAGGNASFGTVSSVSGKSLYLTDLTGNTVKVTLSSATTITKSLPVSSRSVHPGDTVVIQGLKDSDGTISAASVSDTGNRGGGTTSGGGSAAGGTSSGGSSAVNSLFGSGG
jgi:hypothetical protein